jgi:hypothetical protein
MRSFFLLVLIFNLSASLAFATIPPDYYNSLNAKSSAALKTELHDILMRDTSYYYAYGSGINRTWNGFYITDRNTTTNLVLDMYSDSLRYFASDYISQGYPSFGQQIHIEHSLPKSWWGSHEWAAYKDLNHLFPSNGSMNLSKSNNPLGVVIGKPTKDNGVSKSGSAVYDGYIGKVFEPADYYKGDFARAYFYMATAYEHYENLWDTSLPENMMENNSYPVFKKWAIDLLLEWSRQDPVSEKERARNENVFSIQANRNPFIDHAELAEYIWGFNVGKPWNIPTSNQNTVFDDFEIQFNSDSSTFTIISKNKTPISYIIRSMTGQKLVQAKSMTNIQIQVPKLKKNVYLLEISSQNNISKRVLKFISR